MKQITSATFRDTFMDETEAVEVRRYNTILGVWIPKAAEVLMDDIANKAIEPEQVKAKRGKLTKGLGDLPGEDVKPTVQRDPYREFRPAPKPGKGK